MSSQTPYEALETAIALLGYQWSVKGDEFALTDEIHAIEALQTEAAAFPQEQLPSRSCFPRWRASPP